MAWPQALYCGWQLDARHTPPVQTPEQHWLLAVQIVPAMAQVDGRHSEFTQLVPAQQSPFAAQGAPDAWHAQRPPVQPIAPQHWALLVHVAPASMQQVLVSGEARHESPVQHPPGGVHELPAATQDVVTHVPAVHVWPAAQTRPHIPQWALLVLVLVSHPLLSIPSQLANGIEHPARRHDPFMHAVSALRICRAQSLPHAPQLFRSLAVGTHPPPHRVIPIVQRIWHAATPASPRRTHS